MCPGIVWQGGPVAGENTPAQKTEDLLQSFFLYVPFSLHVFYIIDRRTNWLSVSTRYLPPCPFRSLSRAEAQSRWRSGYLIPPNCALCKPVDFTGVSFKQLLEACSSIVCWNPFVVTKFDSFLSPLTSQLPQLFTQPFSPLIHVFVFSCVPLHWLKEMWVQSEVRRGGSWGSAQDWLIRSCTLSNPRLTLKKSTIR